METFSIAKVPGARQAYLNAIGTGVAIGLVRGIQSRVVNSGIKWGVGTSVGVGLATLQWTRHRRKKERQDLIETIKMLNRKPPGAPGGPPPS